MMDLVRSSGSCFWRLKSFVKGKVDFPGFSLREHDRCETNGRVHVVLQRSLDARSGRSRSWSADEPSESDKNKVVRVTKSRISRKRLGADEEKHVTQASRNENR